jgi:hypothetical protein
MSAATERAEPAAQLPSFFDQAQAGPTPRAGLFGLKTDMPNRALEKTERSPAGEKAKRRRLARRRLARLRVFRLKERLMDAADRFEANKALRQDLQWGLALCLAAAAPAWLCASGMSNAAAAMALALWSATSVGIAQLGWEGAMEGRGWRIIGSWFCVLGGLAALGVAWGGVLSGNALSAPERARFAAAYDVARADAKRALALATRPEAERGGEATQAARVAAGELEMSRARLVGVGNSIARQDARSWEASLGAKGRENLLAGRLTDTMAEKLAEVDDIRADVQRSLAMDERGAPPKADAKKGADPASADTRQLAELAGRPSPAATTASVNAQGAAASGAPIARALAAERCERRHGARWRACMAFWSQGGARFARSGVSAIAPRAFFVGRDGDQRPEARPSREEALAEADRAAKARSEATEPLHPPQPMPPEASAPSAVPLYEDPETQLAWSQGVVASQTLPAAKAAAPAAAAASEPARFHGRWGGPWTSPGL